MYALLGADTNPPKSAPRQTVRPSSASEPDPLVWTQVLAGLQARYPASASFKLEHGTAQAIPATAMRRADTYRFDPATGRITHTQLHRDKPRPQTAKGLLFALHTGSWGGWVTQVVYFLAALVGGTLPLTGYYLWIRRMRRPPTP